MQAQAVTVAAFVALFLAPASALAAGPTATEFRNGEPSTFGSVDLPVYLGASAGTEVAFAVPLTLHPEDLRVPAARYLVGFNLKSDVVRLHDVSLTVDGEPVAIERDDRGDAQQPRLIVPGDALPRDAPVELLLSGQATTTADGQAHVGVLAIAFNAGWDTLHTRDGQAAQVYGFTMLMSTGHPSSGFAPRFQGMGNSGLALLPLIGLATATGFGLRAAKHTLYPPPPKPVKVQPAARPVPATVAQPATAVKTTGAKRPSSPAKTTGTRAQPARKR